MRRWSQLLFWGLLAFMVSWTVESCAADPQPQPADAPVTSVQGDEPATSASPGDSLVYSPNWPEPPNTGAMLLRLVLGTVFVLTLCVVSLWLGKPWLLKLQGVTATGGQALQIEGSVTLGNRAVLYLIKVGDTQLVAGTDPTGLKSLITLPSSFKDVLEEQVGGNDAADQPAADAVTPDNFELRLSTAAAA
ncbi:MAG: flagellar biosynthetic protein FliO [Planctomycetes bacterium]|nr:flagellar biosynthetic protein FliO [Planctomycetota bacterium]